VLSQTTYQEDPSCALGETDQKHRPVQLFFVTQKADFVLGEKKKYKKPKDSLNRITFFPIFVAFVA
jgi:hypothetical protein